jgi:hypothetical protein
MATFLAMFNPWETKSKRIHLILKAYDFGFYKSDTSSNAIISYCVMITFKDKRYWLRNLGPLLNKFKTGMRCYRGCLAGYDPFAVQSGSFPAQLFRYPLPVKAFHLEFPLQRDILRRETDLYRTCLVAEGTFDRNLCVRISQWLEIGFGPQGQFTRDLEMTRVDRSQVGVTSNSCLRGLRV